MEKNRSKLEDYIEHPAERALREHAEECKCESFSAKRFDLEQNEALPPPMRAAYGFEGSYVWCGRKYDFRGILGNGKYHADIILTGMLKKGIRFDPETLLETMCESDCNWTGFQPAIHPHDDGRLVMVTALRMRLCPVEINSISINWASREIDEAILRYNPSL